MDAPCNFKNKLLFYWFLVYNSWFSCPHMATVTGLLEKVNPTHRLQETPVSESNYAYMWMKGQTVQRNTRFPKCPRSCRRSLTYSLHLGHAKQFLPTLTHLFPTRPTDSYFKVYSLKPSRFCLTPPISFFDRGSGSSRREPKLSAPAPHHHSSWAHHNNVLFAKWLIPFWFTAIVKRHTLGGGPRYLSCQGRARGHAFYWSMLIKALNSDQRRFQPSIMVNSD